MNNIKCKEMEYFINKSPLPEDMNKDVSNISNFTNTKISMIKFGWKIN